MTSPHDTTLRERSEKTASMHRQLVVVCVAARPLLPPRRFDLPSKGALELGRATDPDVLGLAADPRVSRRHAQITRDADARVVIAPLGTAALYVNGEPVTKKQVLEDGDVVLLGESAFVLRESLERFDGAGSDEGIVGISPAMVALRKAVTKVAKTKVTVLLLGESGTGKEVVARALHDRSKRGGAFVAVNCAAIPGALAEAQLFGHVAGAFTGAVKASPGLFRAAEGGTLFLDELGDLPLELQPKLLRVLEERKVSPVGATAATPVDVRVVTATHHDLFDDVQADRFRGDLYARIAEYVVHMPPLRARREDVLLLLSHLYRGLHGESLPALSFALIRSLLLHPWPFNVRELRSAAVQLELAAVEGAVLDTTALELRPLTPKPATPAPTAAPGKSAAKAQKTPKPEGGPPSRDDLIALLRRHKGNVAELARSQDRSRKQVYRWLESLGVDPTEYREG
jgi:DNA-binding NtrC family response regulator